MADVVLCWISSGALANNAVSPEMEMSDMSYKSCRGHAIWISRSTDYWVLGALIWQWTTETGEALGTCLACCPTCRFDIFQNSWWLLTEGTECSCKVYVETTWHHYCMTTYHLLPCLQKHVNPIFFCWHLCLFSFKVYNTWQHIWQAALVWSWKRRSTPLQGLPRHLSSFWCGLGLGSLNCELLKP